MLPNDEPEDDSQLNYGTPNYIRAEQWNAPYLPSRLETPAAAPEPTASLQPPARSILAMNTKPSNSTLPWWDRAVGIVSIAGGLLWAIAWILEARTQAAFGGPVTILGLDADDYSWLTAIPIFLLLLAATGLHLLLRRSYTHQAVGWVGFVAMVIAFILLGWGVLTPAEGGRYLWIVSFPLIIISQSIWGGASLPPATPLNTAMLPKWFGLSLLIGSLVGIFAVFSSLYLIGIALGVPWIVIGYALLRDQAAPVSVAAANT